MELIEKVKLSQKGDKEVLTRLILKKKDMLYKIAFSYIKNEQDSLDILQDTILDVYEKIENLKKPQFFYTWVIRILINNCNDRYNKNRRNCFMDSSQDIQGDEPSARIADRLDLQAAIVCLDNGKQEIILLHLLEGLTFKEIAKIFNCSESTIKYRYYAGLEKMKNILSGGE